MIEGSVSRTNGSGSYVSETLPDMHNALAHPSPLCLELRDGEGKADEGEGHGAHRQRPRACGYVPDPDPVQ